MASVSRFLSGRISASGQDEGSRSMDCKREEISSSDREKTSRTVSEPLLARGKGVKNFPSPPLVDPDIFSGQKTFYIEGKAKKSPLAPVLHALRHQKKDEEISPCTLLPQGGTLRGRVQKIKERKTESMRGTREMQGAEDLSFSPCKEKKRVSGKKEGIETMIQMTLSSSSEDKEEE